MALSTAGIKRPAHDNLIKERKGPKKIKPVGSTSSSSSAIQINITNQMLLSDLGGRHINIPAAANKQRQLTN
jgi:hypothetical protein